MAKYYINYIDKNGDSCRVWTRAHNAQEAKENAKQEYWDIQDIVSVHKAND